jgi:hypothetical protein
MVFNRNIIMQSGGASNNFLFYAIIIIILFFLIIMPLIESLYNKEKKEIIEKLENAMIPLKIDTQKCSRSCCINSGWPLPDDLKENDIPEKELKNYISTNLSCNNSSRGGGSGCVCVQKKDYELLSTRGNNGVIGCHN